MTKRALFGIWMNPCWIPMMLGSGGLEETLCNLSASPLTEHSIKDFI